MHYGFFGCVILLLTRNIFSEIYRLMLSKLPRFCLNVREIGTKSAKKLLEHFSINLNGVKILQRNHNLYIASRLLHLKCQKTHEEPIKHNWTLNKIDCDKHFRSIYFFVVVASHICICYNFHLNDSRSDRLQLQKHMVVNCYCINALQCILWAQKITEPGQLKSERPIWQTKKKRIIFTERTAANARQTLSLSKCTRTRNMYKYNSRSTK